MRSPYCFSSARLAGKSLAAPPPAKKVRNWQAICSFFPGASRRHGAFHKRRIAMNKGIALLGGLGLGAGLMYFFDPALGRRRRVVARDQLTAATNDLCN